MSTGLRIRRKNPSYHALGNSIFSFDDILSVYNNLTPQQKEELNLELSKNLGLPDKIKAIALMLESKIFESIPDSPDGVYRSMERLIAPPTTEEVAVILSSIPNYNQLTESEKFKAKVLLNIPNEPIIVNGINFGNPRDILNTILSKRLNDKLFNNVIDPAKSGLESGLKKRVIPYIIGGIFGGIILGSFITYRAMKK